MRSCTIYSPVKYLCQIGAQFLRRDTGELGNGADSIRWHLSPHRDCRWRDLKVLRQRMPAGTLRIEVVQQLFHAAHI